MEPMSRYTRLLPALAVTAALLHPAAPLEAQQQRRGPPPTPVEVGEATMEDIETSAEVDGFVVAGSGIDVTATTTAKVTLAPLKIGQQVARGEVVARMDTTSLAETLARQRIDEERGAARIQRLEAQITVERERLEVATELLEIQESRLDRFTNLADEQVLTRTRLDDVRQAMLEKRQAKLVLEKAISQLEQNADDARLNQQRLAIDIAATAREIAEADITAPQAGQITAIAGFSEGFVREGESLMTIRSGTDYEIEADLPVAWVALVEAAGRVDIVDDSGLAGMTADVRAALPSVNTRSGTRLLRLTPSAPLPDHLGAVGARLKLRIPTAERRRYVTVPADAVLPLRGGHVVFVANGDRAGMRQVKVGGTRRGRVVIIEGLEAGARVITRGNELLVHGMPIRPAAPGSSAESRP